MLSVLRCTGSDYSLVPSISSYYFRFAYLFPVSKHNVKVVLKKYHIHIMLEEFEDTKGVSK